MSSIYQRIVDMRKTLGLNQINFAKELDIKQPTLVGYEKGSSLPSADFLVKIREVFNANIDWLLTGEGEMFLSKQEKALENTHQTEEKHPLIASLGAFVDQRLEKIEVEIANLKKVEAQIAEIKSSLNKPSINRFAHITAAEKSKKETGI